jgi:3-deoxy-D-manno-octulosonic-acid transferase
MYLLYSILMVSWGILLIPIFLYKAWRHHKYLPGLRQRLGRLPENLRSRGTPTIWFHCCSVGETLSVQPLAHLFHQRFPQARFVFSTVTSTGQSIARQRFSIYGEANTFFFPIDLASVAKRVLDFIRPAMIIIIDTEIWPNVVHQAWRRSIPVVLVNGRISAASFRYYRWARPVLRRVFRNYRILLMKSDEDARRILQMGAPPDKVLVTGNLKYDLDLVKRDATAAAAGSLDEALGPEAIDAPLIVAGSTHPGEEDILLEVLGRVRNVPGLEHTRLLLAPRHPERFDEVAGLVERAGYAVQRRTRENAEVRAPVLLLDTMGELAAAYRFATIAFVGGTLVRRGGHSILEPALYAKPIVIGPSTENFSQVVEEFLQQEAVRQITATEENRSAQVGQLSDAITGLLQDRAACAALGRAACSVLENNSGATHRTMEKIAEIYEETDAVKSAPSLWFNSGL